MLLNAETSTLVLVDYQPRLLPALSGAERAVSQAVRLAQLAQLADVPILATEHYPAKLGETTPPLRPLCQQIVTKQSFDACADGLLEALPGQRDDIVIAGCETHVCMLQTAMGVLAGGYRAWIVTDACASRRPEDHALALGRLKAAGATLISAEMAGFEWLRHGDHPAFREALALIRPL
ncbi:isochorismatase family protein [Alcanivorax quisquiliarum]|uniref:Isochorismatase family protein n=1 Tax=Alcanivorax quisquiliarum TaxID=2933565 RepID=A0ABT0E3Y9_9GAMM|nr:isochorismatase family protein [Alcanivorax quisquiliarum]MCK0536478.1 isochorismatase family protein [Alcanivorax quisquiliarum]